MSIGKRDYYSIYKIRNIKEGKEVLPDSVFSTILDTIGTECSQIVLDGGVVNFGHGTGDIFIMVKPNTKPTVDWDESIKLLIEIAKKVAPHVLNKYKNGIHRANFSKEMVEYVYHKTLRPNAPKWLIMKKKLQLTWFHWTKRNCIIPNRGLYSFTPTSYIHLKDKDGNEYKYDELLTVLTKETLRDYKNVGNIQKKNLLEDWDDSHIFKYREATI